MARTCKGVPHRARPAKAAATVQKASSSIKKSTLTANEAALYVKEVLNAAEKAIDAAEKSTDIAKKAGEFQHTNDESNAHWELKTYDDLNSTPLPLYKSYVKWEEYKIIDIEDVYRIIDN